jgi:predicted metal-dependent peptidase
MEFTRVVGKIDEKLVYKAEEKLSQVFIELGTRYDNEHVGSGLGGDPMIFTLIYPIEHYCTNNIPTAATDGKRYYWNPKWVVKQSRIGLRIICAHEAWHAIYMHPQRRGSRLPSLWNIAVDFIVNSTVMEDFKIRKQDPVVLFNKNLGRFMTLEQYAELIKNPFGVIKGFEDLNPAAANPSTAVSLPSPDEDRELTQEELKELERREKSIKFFYADPDLPEGMKRPEAIYDYLYNLLPKCPKCGRIGYYKLPNSSNDKDKSGDGDNKGKQKNSQNGSGQKKEGNDNGKSDMSGGGSCCSGDHDGPCDECGGGIDILGLGGTVDEHLDTEESQEKLAKRISDAIEASRKMAGKVPAALEDELGLLTAPKVTWRDIIRSRLLRARSGSGRDDWTRFRTRPMFIGLLVPKRQDLYATFGCLLDTSGSMSKDDMAFGLSQLCSLDERAEGTIVCADAEIYWDKATKIRRANKEEISRIKPVGRGGTVFASFFSDYQKNIGKCDFLIIITDGFLIDVDNMINPGIDVYWLITSSSAFKAPFGRVLDLHN